MRPLQRARPLLLLALLVLCMSLGQAKDEKNPPEDAVSANVTGSTNLSPRCVSPPLLSLALGAAAAFLLHLP